jgi:hypothetical protein
MGIFAGFSFTVKPQHTSCLCDEYVRSKHSALRHGEILRSIATGKSVFK